MQYKTIQDKILYSVFGYLTMLFEKCKWHIFLSAFILQTELNMICKYERQLTNKHNMEARSHNHCFRGKATSITYSECQSVDFVV